MRCPKCTYTRKCFGELVLFVLEVSYIVVCSSWNCGFHELLNKYIFHHHLHLHSITPQRCNLLSAITNISWKISLSFQKFKIYVRSDDSLNGINLASCKYHYQVLILIFPSIGEVDCCWGFPGGSDGRVHLQGRRPGFDPWVGTIPWRKEWIVVPFSSVAQSCPTLGPHESQHTRPPYFKLKKAVSVKPPEGTLT